jgi:hypothetical protein
MDPNRLMNLGTYNLQIGHGSDCIVTALSGFFSLGQVAAYAGEAEQLIREVAARYGRYRMVIDIRACAIQSQDVIAAFGAHVAGVPRADRLAVVVSGAIIRAQIRRIIGRPELAIFENFAEAVGWVDDASEEEEGALSLSLAQRGNSFAYAGDWIATELRSSR